MFLGSLYPKLKFLIVHNKSTEPPMKCKACGNEVQLPFKCNFCQGSFCEEHRLPESHNCSSAPPRLPLGSWESKQRLSKKPADNKSKFVSEGDFHFVKKQLPTFEMPKKKKKFGFLKRKKAKKKDST